MKFPPKRPSSAGAPASLPRHSHVSSTATVVGGKVQCRGFPCGAAWKCSFCVERLEAEHNAKTAEARAAAAAAAALQSAAEEQLDAGKATILQANSLIPLLQRQLQASNHACEVKDAELLLQRNACDDLGAQLAFATNSDHTEALAHAAATLADVTRQLQAERQSHADTQEKLRLKSVSHAALVSDLKHLKELATQSRLAKQQNIHASRQQEAAVCVLRGSLDDVTCKLRDKTTDADRLAVDLKALQGQYSAAVKTIEDLNAEKAKMSTELLKLQVQKENFDSEMKSRAAEIAAKDRTVESLTKKVSALSSQQTNAAYQMKLMQKNLEQLKSAARKSGVTVEKA